MSDYAFNFDFPDDPSTPVPALPATPAPVTPTELVKEIDLGDGSGKQVFKGTNYEELTDRLLEAQRNATLKIQELSRQQAQAPYQQIQQQEQVQPLTAEEEFALGQQFAQMPSATLDRLFQARTGVSLEEVGQIKQYVDGMAYAQQVGGSVNEFLINHEGVDYFPCVENKQLLENFLATNGLDMTVPNLEYAHSSLVRGGLLYGPPPDDVKNTSSPFPITMTGEGQPFEVPVRSREAEVKAWLAKASPDEIRLALKAGQLG